MIVALAISSIILGLILSFIGLAVISAILAIVLYVLFWLVDKHPKFTVYTIFAGGCLILLMLSYEAGKSVLELLS